MINPVNHRFHTRHCSPTQKLWCLMMRLDNWEVCHGEFSLNFCKLGINCCLQGINFISFICFVSFFWSFVWVLVFCGVFVWFLFFFFQISIKYKWFHSPLACLIPLSAWSTYRCLFKMLLVNFCYERKISLVLVLCIFKNLPMNIVLNTKPSAILNVPLIYP